MRAWYTSLRDDFDSGYAIHDDDGGVDHGQSHLGLMDEHVESRSIEDVDLGLAPLDDSQTGRDRHLAGDLFVVVIGRGGTVIDAAEAGSGSRGKEHGGGEGSFARVPVAYQRDIPYVFSGIGFQVGSPSGRRGRKRPIRRG